MTGHKNHEMAVAEAGADAPASFVIQPQPQGGNFMGKLGIFGLGFVAGVVSIAMIATSKSSNQSTILQSDSSLSSGEVIDLTPIYIRK